MFEVVEKQSPTSWEVKSSRYIIMDRNEFAWATTITCFPAISWGSICRTGFFKDQLYQQMQALNTQESVFYMLWTYGHQAHMLFKIRNSPSQAHFQTLSIGWSNIITSTPFMNLFLSISFSCFLLIITLKLPIPVMEAHEIYLFREIHCWKKKSMPIENYILSFSCHALMTGTECASVSSLWIWLQILASSFSSCTIMGT